MIQALADVSIVRSLPPTVFWPRPQVDSAVVAIRPRRRQKRAAVGDVAWFHEIVRRLFFHRRKYIRHVLAATWRDEWSKAEVDTLARSAWTQRQAPRRVAQRRRVCRPGKGPARALGRRARRARWPILKAR